MNILEKSREFSVYQLYHLTKDPSITNLKDHVGEVLEITGYLLREDEGGGQNGKVLSLGLSEGGAVSTNSPTVQKSFADILALYAGSGVENPYPIMVEVFTAEAKKSGRTYCDIRLVEAD